MKRIKILLAIVASIIFLNLFLPLSAFAASSAPTVVTNDATNVTKNSATLNGVVTAFNVDGENTSEVGFYYCVYGTGNYKKVKAGTSVTKYMPFSVTVSGLSSGTKYSYYAYAINSKGTGTASSSKYFTTTAISIPVTSVTLNKTSLSMTVGGSTQTLTATVTPSNATNKTVTWSTDKSAVATVNSSGVVTPKGVGTCKITAKANDGSGKYGQCTVTVSAPILVTGITLNKTSLSMTVGGSTQTLTATVTPSNATNKTVTWSTDKSTVATVNSSGVVTPKGVGTCKITAKANDGSGKYSQCTVTVSAPVLVSSITLNKTSLSMTAGGSAQTLTATVTPSNATNKTVTWSTDKSAVATVSSSGVVTPKGVGTCKITAKANDGSGMYGQCTVTVSAPILVTGITLNKTSLSMTVGGSTQTLTATVTPSNATNKTVTWSTDKSAVATVNSSGVVTPKGVGTCKITAKANDGSGKYGQCTVTVSAPMLVTSITLNKTSLSMTAGGSKQTLIAIVSPSNAANKTITWSTSKSTVATVDSTTGVVTPKGIGTCIITAKANDGSGNQAQCTVTVAVEAPTITTQPKNITVTIGGKASLCVVASGSGKLSYQWYSNTSNSTSGGKAISGATSATYEAPATTVGTMYYYCIVKNTIGTSGTTKTSGTASVTVTAILEAPQGLKAALVESNKVVLNWQSVNGAVAYNIHRTKVLDGSKVTFSNYKGTSYEDSTVKDQTSYYYSVVAVSSDGKEGKWATSITVTTPAIFRMVDEIQSFSSPVQYGIDGIAPEFEKVEFWYHAPDGKEQKMNEKISTTSQGHYRVYWPENHLIPGNYQVFMIGWKNGIKMRSNSISVQLDEDNSYIEESFNDKPGWVDYGTGNQGGSGVYKVFVSLNVGNTNVEAYYVEKNASKFGGFREYKNRDKKIDTSQNTLVNIEAFLKASGYTLKALANGRTLVSKSGKIIFILDSQTKYAYLDELVKSLCRYFKVTVNDYDTEFQNKGQPVNETRKRVINVRYPLLGGNLLTFDIDYKDCGKVTVELDHDWSELNKTLSDILKLGDSFIKNVKQDVAIFCNDPTQWGAIRVLFFECSGKDYTFISGPGGNNNFYVGNMDWPQWAKLIYTLRLP